MKSQKRQFEGAFTRFKSVLEDYRQHDYSTLVSQDFSSQILDDLYLICCFLFGILGFVLLLSGLNSLSTVSYFLAFGKSVVGSAFIVYSTQLAKSFCN